MPVWHFLQPSAAPAALKLLHLKLSGQEAWRDGQSRGQVVILGFYKQREKSAVSQC